MGLLDSVNDKKPGGNTTPSDSTHLTTGQDQALATGNTLFERVNLESKPTAPAEKKEEKKDDRNVATAFGGAIVDDVKGLGHATANFFFNTDQTANYSNASLASQGGTGLGASVIRSVGGLFKTAGTLIEKPSIITNGIADLGNTIVNGSANDRAALLGHTAFFVATIGAGGGAAAKGTGLIGAEARTAGVLGDIRTAQLISKEASALDLAGATLKGVERTAGTEALTSPLATSRLSAATIPMDMVPGASRSLIGRGGTNFLTTAEETTGGLSTAVRDLKAGSLGVQVETVSPWKLANTESGTSWMSRWTGKGEELLANAEATGTQTGRVLEGSGLKLTESPLTRLTETPITTKITEATPLLTESTSPVMRLTEMGAGTGQKTLSILDHSLPVAQDGTMVTARSQAMLQVETHVGEVGAQVKALRTMEQAGSPAVQDALTFIEQNGNKLSTVGQTAMKEQMAIVEKALGTDATAALKTSVTRLEQSTAAVQNLSSVEGALGKFNSSTSEILGNVAASERGPLQQVFTQFEKGSATVQDVRSAIQQLSVKEPQVAAQLTKEFAQVEKALVETSVKQSFAQMGNVIETSLPKVAAESRPALTEVQQTVAKFEQGTASIQEVKTALQTLAKSEPEVAATLTRELTQVEKATVQASRVETAATFTNTAEQSMAKVAVENQPALREVQQAFTKFESGTASIQEVKTAVQTLAKTEPTVAATLTRELTQVEQVVATANRIEAVAVKAEPLAQFTTAAEQSVAKVAVENQPALREVQQAFTKFESGTASIQEVRSAVQTLAKTEPEVAATLTRELAQVEKATVQAGRVEAVSTFSNAAEQSMTKVAVENQPALREVQQAFTKFESGTASIQEVKTAMQTLAKSEPEVAAQLTRELTQVERATVQANRLETATTFTSAAESSMAKVAVENQPALREVQQAFTKFESGSASIQEVKSAVQTLAKSEPEVAAQLTRELTQVEKATITANKVEATAVKVETATQFTSTVESSMTKVAADSQPALKEVQQAFTKFESGTASIQEVKTAVQTLAKSEPEVAAQLTRQLTQVERASTVASVTESTAARIEQVSNFNSAVESSFGKVATEIQPVLRDVQQTMARFESGTASIQEVKTAVQTLAKTEPEVAATLTRELTQVERATITANKVEASAVKVESATQFTSTVERSMTKVATENQAALRDVQQAFTKFESGTATVQEVRASVQTLAKTEPEVAAQLTRELTQVEKASINASRVESAAVKLETSSQFANSVENSVGRVAAENQGALRDVQQSFAKYEQGTASIQEVKNAVQTLAKTEPGVATQLAADLGKVEKAAVQVERVEASAAAVNRLESVQKFSSTVENSMTKVAAENQTALRDVQQAMTKYEQGAASIQEVRASVQNLAKSEPEVAAQLTRDLAKVERNAVMAERVEAVGKVNATLEGSMTKVASENQVALRDVQQTFTKFEQGTATAQEVRTSVQALAKTEPEVAAQLTREIGQVEKLSTQANQMRFAEMATTNVAETSALYKTTVGESTVAASTKVESVLARDAKLIESDVSGLKSIQQSIAKAGVDGPGAMAEIKSTMQTLSPKVARELEPSIVNMDNAIAATNRIKTAETTLTVASEAHVSLAAKSETVAKMAQTTGDIEAMNAFKQAQSRIVIGADNTAAVTEMRASMKAMDSKMAQELTPAVNKLEATANRANAELFDLHGNRISQNLTILRETGNLGTTAQMQRLDMVRNDINVLKNLSPAESATYQQLLKLDKQMSGVESISNILAHPEVARASFKNLLKMVGSDDAMLAQAAADRLVLMGKAGRVTEAPVLGLMTDRQKFWLGNNDILNAVEQGKMRLFISGRVAGLSGDETLAQLTSSRNWLLGSTIPLSLGFMYYQREVRDAVWLATHPELKAAKNADGSTTSSPKSEAAAAGAKTEQVAKVIDPSKDNNGKPGDTQRSANQAEAQKTAAQGDNRTGKPEMERTSYTTTQANVSNQATFRSNPDEARMPIVAKFMPQEQAVPKSVAHSINNTNLKDWWWMANQHGGNWSGYQRGPGAPPVVEVAQTSQPVQQPRVRFAGTGNQPTDQGDAKKLVVPSFDRQMRNQAELLNDPKGTKREFTTQIRPITFFGVQTVKNLQTTVDWTQGVHRSGSTEGRKGHDLRHLGPLEQGEEVSLDAPGSGGGGSVASSDPNNQAAQAGVINQDDEHDPNKDPNTVQMQGGLQVASASGNSDEEEQQALINRV